MQTKQQAKHANYKLTFQRWASLLTFKRFTECNHTKKTLNNMHIFTAQRLGNSQLKS